MGSDLTTVKEAVSYPWDGGEAAITLVVGGILTLLSPLVIPGLLVLGYGLRVIEAVMAGQSAPPRFGDWRELFIDGVKAGVVLLVYVVAPLIVGGVVLVAVAGAAGFRFAGAFLFRGFSAGGLALVAALLLAGFALVVTYIAPAALVHLARTGRLGAALTFDDVRGLAETDAYGAAWLIALAVFAAAGVVLTVLYAAAIGVVVSGFVTFYAFVAMAYLYAHGAGEAGISLEGEEAAESVAEPETE